MLKQLKYLEDIHIVTVGEAAYASLLLAFTDGLPEVYDTAVGGWAGKQRKLGWRAYNVSSWVVDAAGLIIPGVCMVLATPFPPPNAGFQEVARQWQGNGIRCNRSESFTFPLDWGLAVILATPAVYLTGGETICTRMVYEVDK